MRIACVGRRSPDGSPCEVSGPPTTTASSIVDIRHTRPALRLRVRRGDGRAAYPVRKLHDETRESTQRAHTSAEREQKFTHDTSIAPICCSDRTIIWQKPSYASTVELLRTPVT